MRLQYIGIDAPFLLADRTESDGAGDIGRAVAVLCAAVKEQQSFGAQGNIAFGCGLVVHDGSMGAVSGDRIERDVTEEFLFTA